MHLAGIVHRPCEELHARTVEHVRQGPINQGALLPQHRSARVLERRERLHEVGRAQHAARQGGTLEPEPPHDAVVEAVHGVPRRVRAVG